MKRLTNKFFERKTLTVAKDLIGKFLVRKVGNKIHREMITEVEAYIGPHDLASHSSKGRTARTEVMFGESGTVYVYFVYGMHWMLNIVTEKKDFPAAVLIRSTSGARGPGRVTKKFGIDKNLNGKKLGTSSGLWIEDGLLVKPSSIIKGPRVGVAYAGIWANKPYRFILKER